MSVDELLRAGLAGSSQAFLQLEHIGVVGAVRPVPAALLTQVLVQLRSATVAVTELERRAQGGPAPAVGGLPDAKEPRNRV